MKATVAINNHDVCLFKTNQNPSRIQGYSIVPTKTNSTVRDAPTQLLWDKLFTNSATRENMITK